MAPLRVLALCGYSHNASIFSQQVRKALLNNVGSWSALPKAQSLQVLPSGSAAQIGQVKAEGPATEVVFLDPTVVLTKEQLMPFHIEDLARYKGGQEVTTPRAWWTAPDRATYGSECRLESLQRGRETM
jgi:hypothetical protein